MSRVILRSLTILMILVIALGFLLGCTPREEMAPQEEVTELEPTTAMAYLSRGDKLREEGDLTGAKRAYQEAMELEPDNAMAHLKLGDVFRQKGYLEGAIDAYQKSVELNPRQVGAHYGLGLSLAEQGFYLSDAIKCIERGIELDPSVADYIDDATSLARDYNRKGVSLAQAGKYEYGVDNITLATLFDSTLIEARDNLAVIYNNFGLFLGQEGELIDAKKNFENAIAVNPNIKEAYNNLGIVLGQEGDIDGAIGKFQEAIKIDPEYAEALNNLGVAFAQQGKLTEAKECFEQAIAINPTTLWANDNLSVVEQAIAGGAIDVEAVFNFEGYFAGPVPTIPQPKIVIPGDGEIVGGIVLIEAVDKTEVLEIASCRFNYCRGEEEWIEIDVDEDGSNGWSTTLDITHFEDGFYALRATMLDFTGNEGQDTIVLAVNTGEELLRAFPELNFAAATTCMHCPGLNEKLRDIIAEYAAKGIPLPHKLSKELVKGALYAAKTIAVDLWRAIFGGIDSSAKIGKNVKIGPHVTVDENVTIGKNTTIGAGTEIDPNCKIGDNVKIGKSGDIDDNVSIGDGTKIGDDVEIDEGSVIGKGVILEDKVDIDDDVSIGDNTRIGAETVIDPDCKIGKNVQIGKKVFVDNDVSIGNNVEIGEGAKIGKGAEIGEGAIIRPGAKVPAGKVIGAGETYPP